MRPSEKPTSEPESRARTPVMACVPYASAIPVLASSRVLPEDACDEYQRTADNTGMRDIRHQPRHRFGRNENAARDNRRRREALLRGDRDGDAHHLRP